METISDVKTMQQRAAALRAEGARIAFVPTMGYLHEGHLALIDAARQHGDRVVVSIFVNPTQFGPNEDYESYPRDEERDLALCEERGAQIVFTPPREALYPPGYSTYVSEEKLSTGLCGVSRPHHFRGVTTICTKLFNIVMPHAAIFGEKDAQQCAIIRKLVADLNLPIEIVSVPTVRESDGLAMSSRNAYLTPEQRTEATRIYAALQKGRALYEQGISSVDRIVAEVTHQLTTGRRVRVIYVVMVDRDTLEPVKTIQPGRTLVAVAAWVDQVRLIDNIIL